MSFLDATATSARPKTASHTTRFPWYNDQDSHQLPPMPSSSAVLSDNSTNLRPRTGSPNPKRLSIFKNRSRSNTATSTNSSYQSPASSMTSMEGSSQRSSEDERALSSFFLPIEKEESRAKALLMRGSRLLKRQGSRLNLSSSADDEDEMGGEKSKGKDGLAGREKEKSEGLGIFHLSHRSRHSDMHEFLKRNISEPFDFQHVTHTNQGQLPPMARTHLHDIATEFSIIRASQRPARELRGIRAASIYGSNFSLEDVSTSTLVTLAPDEQSLYTRSPPGSPVRSKPPISPNSSANTRLASRSVENFSRPVSRANRPSSMLVAPRESSKSVVSDLPETTCQTIDAMLGLHSPATFPENIPSSSEDKPVERPALSPPLESSQQFDDIYHAYSTDDHSARGFRSSPLGHTPDLADVPEEDETSSRCSRVIGSRTDHYSQNNISFHRRARVGSPLRSRPPPISRSQSDERVPTKSRFEGPQMANNLSIKRQPSLRMRQNNQGSWEEVIDYCYEHAAESNSNFDWQDSQAEETRSKFDPLAVTVTTPTQTEFDRQAEYRSSGASTTNNSAKSHQGAPDLQPAIAFSTPTRPESASPSGSANMPEIFPTLGQTTSKPKPEPIQLLPEHEVSPDRLYGDYIPHIHESDEHYVYIQTDDQVESARSSGCPISKCNSQESMILSRAGSIARKHRSSTSTNSVPDLIHSPNESRETVEMTYQPLDQQNHPLASRPPLPAVHSRSKSLAKETIQYQDADKPSVPQAPIHDRAKSASVLDSQDCSTPQEQNSPVKTRRRSSTTSRGRPCHKSRTSYSLFPVAKPPTPK